MTGDATLLHGFGEVLLLCPIIVPTVFLLAPAAVRIVKELNRSSE